MKVKDAKVGKIKHCQICGSSNLIKVISLGFSGLCDSLLTNTDLNNFGYEDITNLPWIEIDFPKDLEKAKNKILLEIDE